MRIVPLLCLCITLVLTACGTIAEANLSSTEPIDHAQISRGIEVYRQNYCGSCHVLSIANTRGMFGPEHDSIVANAEQIINSTVYTGDASTIEGYIYESIVNPNIFFTPTYEATNHHMPAFGHLPGEDLDAMVYMLIHQADYDGNAD